MPLTLRILMSSGLIGAILVLIGITQDWAWYAGATLITGSMVLAILYGVWVAP